MFVTQAFAPSQLMTVLGGGLPFDARSLVLGSLVEHVGWQDSREFMLPPLLELTQRGRRDKPVRPVFDARSDRCASSAPSLVSGVGLDLAALHARRRFGAEQPLDVQIGAPDPVRVGGGAGELAARAPGGGHGADGGRRRLRPGPVPVPRLRPGSGPAPGRASWWRPLTPCTPSGSRLFLGWLLKAPLVRYGGMRAYRLALPFFLGPDSGRLPERDGVGGGGAGDGQGVSAHAGVRAPLAAPSFWRRVPGPEGPVY